MSDSHVVRIGRTAFVLGRSRRLAWEKDRCRAAYHLHPPERVIFLFTSAKQTTAPESGYTRMFV